MRLSFLVGSACVALLASTVSAQTTAGTASGTRYFDVGYTGLGPAVALGGIGSANVAFGGRLEHAVKAVPDLGGGILGIGLDVDVYQYTSTYAGGSSGLTYVPVGVTANYHFKLDDPKWDLFLGLGLGYSVVSASGGGTTISATSGFYAIGRAGVRYFWNRRAALQLDTGAGAAALSLGVIFRL